MPERASAACAAWCVSQCVRARGVFRGRGRKRVCAMHGKSTHALSAKTAMRMHECTKVQLVLATCQSFGHEHNGRNTACALTGCGLMRLPSAWTARMPTSVMTVCDCTVTVHLTTASTSGWSCSCPPCSAVGSRARTSYNP